MAVKTNLEKLQESVKENFEYLYSIINGDPFAKEEAEEFLDALKDNVADLEKEYKEQIEDHEQTISSYEDDDDYTDEIRTVDVIRWKTGNIMDSYVMEALTEAYEKYSPSQIIDLLQGIPGSVEETQLEISSCFVDDLL